MSRLAALDPLLNEWRQNTRLRLGTWLVLAILIGYGLLLLSDHRRALESNYRSLADRLERLQGLVIQTEWPERATAARALRVQLESRFWTANSRGLAQANVQTWLDRQLKQVGLGEVRLRVEPALDVPQQNNLWQVSARVEGPFNSKKVVEVLRAVETHPQLTVVEQLDVQQSHIPRFTLVIKAYFQAPA